MKAFDHVIHRDGENWTAHPKMLFFGHPRGRRASQEGDVFVTGPGPPIWSCLSASAN